MLQSFEPVEVEDPLGSRAAPRDAHPYHEHQVRGAGHCPLFNARGDE